MDLVKLFSVLLVCASLLFVCEAQLTFTPSWGKRAPTPLGMNMQNVLGVQDNCKTPVEALTVIYHLIQNEAQKILECNQK
ncbi:hypertrehalosaemic prohormone [Toxorhynchites rutilus septentrionalis]|uniref:hypertrehalosaemic prohormone n=1 Tax=Toxorhynchites rutilus septentrionalis TaxID=329112 RepID=UPI00247A2781|nr:hypertrehalosaemic prohormone [Toxorhynchites rutilus septentrionalis]